MATKLKDPKIWKVDFVDEGANQRADIKLYKRREPGTDDADADKSVLKRAFETLAKALGLSEDSNEDPLKKGSGGEPNGEPAKEHMEKTKKEGGIEEMAKIDKSKMTPEELATFEELEKKYAVNDGEKPVKKKAVNPEENEEEIEGGETGEKKANTKKSNATSEEGTGDIYKNLHPDVKAEIEALKKFREEAELREMKEVAKKYEILGKDPEKLAPMLKSLRAAGGTAYDDMIALMDETVELTKKSGAFEEVGKSGHGEGDGSSVAKIEGIAKKYRDADPDLSYTDSIAKAWENNPDLFNEYEDEANF